jgi:hypothetical protein
VAIITTSWDSAEHLKTEGDNELPHPRVAGGGGSLWFSWTVLAVAHSKI